MSTGGARMGVSGHVAHLEIVASDGGATVSLYNTHYIAFVTAFKAPYRAQDESPDGAATVTARVVHVEYFHKSRNSYVMQWRRVTRSGVCFVPSRYHHLLSVPLILCI